MLRMIAVFVLLVSTGVVAAAAERGESLLIHGALESEQLSFPMPWEKDGSHIGFSPTSGPGNTRAVVFSNSEGLQGVRSSCRQYGQQMIAGETYRMSAYVRAAGFRSRHCGIIVHDNGRHKESGIRSFAENTDGRQDL